MRIVSSERKRIGFLAWRYGYDVVKYIYPFIPSNRLYYAKKSWLLGKSVQGGRKKILEKEYERDFATKLIHNIIKLRPSATLALINRELWFLGSPSYIYSLLKKNFSHRVPNYVQQHKFTEENICYYAEYVFNVKEIFESQPERLKYMDEAHFGTKDSRRTKVWLKKGSTDVFSKKPLVADVFTLSLIAGVSGVSYFAFSKTNTGENWLLFILEAFEAGGLRRGDILIIDNAPVHLTRFLPVIWESCGVLVFFLPKYSPELNPVELVFSFLKVNIKFRDSTQLLKTQVADLISVIPDNLLQKFFNHCINSIINKLLE